MKHDAPTENITVVSNNTGEVIKLGPITLTILEDGSNTDNRIGAVSIYLPPHSVGPPQHWHQVSTLISVVKFE